MTVEKLTLFVLALYAIVMVMAIMHIRFVIATNFIIMRSGEEILKLQRWQILKAEEDLAVLEQRKAVLEAQA